MAEKFSSTIRGASLIVIVVGIFGKGFGFVRELVFAAYFGLSSEFDFYLLAVTLPTIFYTSIGYVIQNYFIPEYNLCRKNSHEEAEIFLRFSLKKFLIYSVIISAILFLSGEIILQALFGNINEKVVSLFNLSISIIPISTVISLLISYQYAEKQFADAGISAIVLNISNLLIVIFFANIIGVYAIVIGMIGGYLLQLIYLLMRVKLNFLKKISHSILKNPKSIGNGAFIYIVIIEVISQLNILVDRNFYPQLHEGGIAALNYALTIYTLPIALFAMAFSTVLFPQFSTLFVEARLTELRDQFRRSTLFTVFLFLPIAYLFFFDGELIVKILIERGKFDSSATAFTFSILKWFSISLVFYSIYSIFNKMIYGINGVKFLFFLTLSGMILKVILNFLLVDKLAETGLALATSLSYIFFAISALIFIHIKIKIEMKEMLKESIVLATLCVSIFGSMQWFYGAISSQSIILKLFCILISFTIYLFASKILEQEYFPILRRTLFFRR